MYSMKHMVVVMSIVLMYGTAWGITVRVTNKGVLPVYVDVKTHGLLGKKNWRIEPDETEKFKTTDLVEEVVFSRGQPNGPLLTFEGGSLKIYYKNTAFTASSDRVATKSFTQYWADAQMPGNK